MTSSICLAAKNIRDRFSNNLERIELTKAYGILKMTHFNYQIVLNNNFCKKSRKNEVVLLNTDCCVLALNTVISQS